MKWSVFMKFVKAFLIWLLIIPFAILNGGLREYFLEPILGKSIALSLSGIILSVIVFVVAYLLIPKIKGCKTSEYVVFGTLWFVLTNLFDFLMIVVQDKPLSAFFEMYDFTTGNLWILVVITSLISPLLVVKIRKIAPVEQKLT